MKSFVRRLNNWWAAVASAPFVIFTVLNGYFVPADAAELIQQGIGENHIAFEAEIGELHDADINGILWGPVDASMAPDSPSGGLALLVPLADEYADDSPGVGSPATAHPGGSASYQLNFTSPGEYFFYARVAYQDQEGDSSPGDEDSFYAPTDFGDSPDFIKQNRIRPLSVNQWNWHNVSDRLSLGWEGYIIGPYSVTNDDLGNTLQFVIGSREGGFLVDRIVLSSRASLTGVQLDVLPNSKVIPEPSTFILCCLIGLASVGGTLRRSR